MRGKRIIFTLGSVFLTALAVWYLGSAFFDSIDGRGHPTASTGNDFNQAGDARDQLQPVSPSSSPTMIMMQPGENRNDVKASPERGIALLLRRLSKTEHTLTVHPTMLPPEAIAALSVRQQPNAENAITVHPTMLPPETIAASSVRQQPDTGNALTVHPTMLPLETGAALHVTQRSGTEDAPTLQPGVNRGDF